MTDRSSHWLALAGVLSVLAVGLLSACSASVGGSSVPADSVAKQAKAAFDEKNGGDGPPISCPEDLPAEVDATITCTVDLDDGTHDITIVVTKVDGDRVLFDTIFAREPNA